MPKIADSQLIGVQARDKDLPRTADPDSEIDYPAPHNRIRERAVGFLTDPYPDDREYEESLTDSNLLENPIDDHDYFGYNYYIREEFIETILKTDDNTFNIVGDFARAVISATPAEQAAMLEAALAAVTAVQHREIGHPSDNSSVPVFDFKPGTLKLNSEFRRVASENQWAKRDRSIWGRDLSKIIDFLKTTYQPWLGRGMSQADLRGVDKGAYQALRNYLKYNDIPSDLQLPTLSKANVDRLAFKEDKDHLLRSRSYDRYRKSLTIS